MSAEKTVVITGAAGAIGLATARQFAREGYNLALTDVRSEGLARVAAELENTAPRIFQGACDTANYSEVQRLAGQILREFKRVDVLVNNAGISQPKGVLELEEEEWDRTIDINLKGAFNWSKALLPSMLAWERGKIISISSMSAKSGGGYGTVSKACYAASKAGGLGFTRGLAKEAAPHVQVNAICPGLITTPMTERLIAEKAEELHA